MPQRQDFLLNYLARGRLLLLAVMLLLMGCRGGEGKKESEAIKESEVCSAQTPLRLVYPKKVNYEILLLADALGYFRAEGLSLQISTVETGMDAATALLTGAADLAAMGDAPAISLATRMPVKFLRRYTGGGKMHRIVGDTSIGTWDRLAGRRVAVQPGSQTSAGLELWLQRKGLQGRVEIVPLAPTEMITALQGGQVDALAGSEPWPSKAEERMGGRIRLLGDFDSLGHSFPTILVGTDRVALCTSEIEKLQGSLDRAVQFLLTHQDSSVALLAGIIGLSPTVQRKATYSMDWRQGWVAVDTASLRMTAEVMLRAGKLRTMPEWSKFLPKHIPPL